MWEIMSRAGGGATTRPWQRSQDEEVLMGLGSAPSGDLAAPSYPNRRPLREGVAAVPGQADSHGVGDAGQPSCEGLDSGGKRALLDTLDLLKSELLTRKARKEGVIRESPRNPARGQAPNAAAEAKKPGLFDQLLTLRSSGAEEATQPGLRALPPGSGVPNVPDRDGSITAKSTAPMVASKCEPRSSDLPAPSSMQRVRHLVLEVQECQDSVLLRTVNESSGAEVVVSLRGAWASGPTLEGGETVNIIADLSRPDAQVPSYMDMHDKSEGAVIFHPDILISGTRVSSGISCERKTVLDETQSAALGPNVGTTSRAALDGTMIHSLIQAALEHGTYHKAFLEVEIEKILSANAEGLYEVDLGLEEARCLLRENFPLIEDFMSTYMPQQKSALQTGWQKGRNGLQIEEIIDIEESIWSPRLGVKGMVDATMAISLDCAAGGEGQKENAGPELRQLRGKPGFGDKGGRVAPMEIKTGKPYFLHNAQLALYMLLLSERYSEPVESGLLWYTKNGHRPEVAGLKNNEIAALLQVRNRIAHSLQTRSLPPVLGHLRQCKNCYNVTNCMLSHKALENGTAESSGVGALYHNLTGEMRPQDARFVADWMEMLQLEEDTGGRRGAFWVESGENGKSRPNASLRQVVCTSAEPEVSEDLRFVYTFAAGLRPQPEGGPANPNLDVGDYVLISREDGVYAAARGFVTRAAQGGLLSVALRSRISPYLLRGDSQPLWRVDRSEMSSLVPSLRGNLLGMFESGNLQREKLRRLIVDQSPPRFEKLSVQMDSLLDAGDREHLNQQQVLALERVLSCEDYALILGMPGTGKTTTIALAVKALVAMGKSVLVTAYTNSAVDNIMRKLIQLGVDFVRLGKSRSIHPAVKEWSLGGARKPAATAEEVASSLEGTAVVGCTCFGVRHPMFGRRTFDCCIVDEASQISVPAVVGPLLYAARFILVGDHYQLPPLVVSKKAEAKGMAVSLFRQLSEAHPAASVALQQQYRMNSSIMFLSNSLIYGGDLRCGNDRVAAGRLCLDPDWEGTLQNSPFWLQDALHPGIPVLFLDTDPVRPPAHESRSDGKCWNECEAALAVSIASHLRGAGLKGEVGFMSPYRGQVARLQELIVQRHSHSTPLLGEHGVRPSQAGGMGTLTIDSAQGRDKECIVLSFVRSNPERDTGDLLTDWRRLNVALTRAKQKLILLGSQSTLREVPMLAELIQILTASGSIRSLPAHSSGWP